MIYPYAHMMPRLTLICLSLFLTSVLAVPVEIFQIFQRPVYNRIYNGEQYTLANTDRLTGNRVDIARVASSLAGLKPSYVCSSLYLNHGDNLTDNMISDFNAVRSAVLAVTPTAKFDVEININSHTLKGLPTFANAAELVSFMEQIDTKLKVDGWWFDFFSNAQKNTPDWVTAATEYAHNRSQTIGGNVFGSTIPPGADAVSFVDSPTNSTFYGFSFNPEEVQALNQNNPGASIILGHLQSNPQNGNTTESCVYINDWDSTQRADYLNYWFTQQQYMSFIYMFPLFFPLCPGAYSFDPLDDVLTTGPPGGTGLGAGATFYDYVQALALGNSTTSTSTVSAPVATRTNSSPTTGLKHRLAISFSVGLLICFLIGL